MKRKGKLLMVFVDREKAGVVVDRESLWGELHTSGIYREEWLMNIA